MITCYAEDLFVFTKYTENIQSLKNQLGKLFKLKDLGNTKQLLGIE